MGNLRARALPTFGATLALTLSAASCLPITNVFDPSGPPDSLALTFVNGSLAFDDGAPLDGVVVDIYREGSGDAGGGERVTASFVASDGRNAFSFEVAPDVTRVVIQPNRCGYGDVSIDIPDAYPEYAANLTPGSEFDINDGRPVVLRRDPPSRTVTGRVEALDETASESGIKVSLVEIGTDGACREPVAEVTTDETGAFSLSPIADGRYVAVAFTEGTTVAISDVVDSCAFATEADGTVPDVEVPLLSIRGGSGALALTASSTDNPDLPPGVIAEPRVNVLIGGFFEWADEMRLSEDPTFASGSTGWVPVQSPRLYPSAGQLQGNTQTTVFGQFRSSCALSPLYSASVTYDGQAPDVFRVRVRDVEADGNVGSDLVTIETEATVSLAVDGFDDIDVRVEVQLSPRDQGVEVPPPQTFVAEGGAGFTLREQIEVPLDEGRYDVLIDVADAAGNAALLAPYQFELIRDTEPPTTPLPSVTEMEISGDVAYLWLEERDCERVLADGTPESYRAFVCEENPREFSFFEVRGGPELLDFTGFDQPPFAVTVFKGEETEFEIRAVDDANNPSESFGRITVTHVNTRELMRLPLTMELGPRATPALTATSGTAFFGATPTAISPEVYDRLIAQPAWEGTVGLDRATSPLPAQLRKLSIGNCGFATCGGDDRPVAALAAARGRVFFIESSWAAGNALPSPMSHVITLDEHGLLPIQDTSFTIGGIGPDDEGEDAPQNNLCTSFGVDDCAPTRAWQGRVDARPEVTRVGDDVVLVGGAGEEPFALLEASGPPAEIRTITGPRWVGMLVQLTPTFTRLWGARAAFDIEEGSTFHYAPMSYSSSPDSYDEAFGAAGKNIGSQAAQGGGVEVLRPPVSTLVYTGDRQEEGMLVGMLIPAGVSIDVPLYAVPPPEGGPAAGARAPVSLGFVEAPFSEDASDFSVTRADVLANLAPTLSMDMTLFRRDADNLRTGMNGGLTVVPLQDGKLPPIAELVDDVGDAPVGVSADYSPLTLPLNWFSSTTATADQVTVPERCVTVVEVEETVALRDVRVEGMGDLDSLYFSVFRSLDDAPTGRFEHHALGDAPPPIGPPVSFTATRLRTEGAPSTQCELLVGDPIASDTASGMVGSVITDVGMFSDNHAAETPDFTGSRPVDANPVEIDVVPVTEGDSFFVALRDDAGLGDVDLYVAFDATPTNSDYVCRPYLIGTFENCFVEAPPGATTMHIALRGYEAGGNPYELFYVDGAVVDQRAISPFGAIFWTITTPSEDFIVRTSIGDAPTWTDYDDYMAPSFSTSYIETDAGGDAFVYLGSPEAFDWQIDYETYDDAIEQLGSVPVVPGQVVQANLSGTGSAGLRVRFDAEPTRDDYDCQTYVSSGTFCGGSAGIVVPPGASVAYYGVFRGFDPSMYTAEVEVLDSGCRSVAGLPGEEASDASALLPPGFYALTLTDGTNETVFAEDPQPPSIEVGTAITDPGPLTVLGAANGVALLASDLVIAGVSANAPVCSLDLTLTTAPSISALAHYEADVLVAAEGAPSALYAGPIEAPVPLEDIALPDGHQVWEASMTSDGAWIVTALPSGAASVLWWLDRRGAAPPDTLVEVAALGTTGVPIRMVSVSFDGDQLLLTGASSTGPQLRSYALDASDPDAPSASTLLTEPLPFLPAQAAMEREDLFLWDPSVEGGRLVHRDLRDVSILYPGGQFESVGFDADEGQLILGLTRGGESISSRLLRFVETPNSDELTLAELADRTPHTHLALVWPTALATISHGLNGPELRLHELVDDAELIPNATTLSVPSASPLLADIAAIAPYNPLEASRDVRLAADEGVLAIIGGDALDPALTLFEIPEAPAAWTGLAPAAGPLPLSAGVRSLSVNGELVVATLSDGHTIALQRHPTDGWTALPLPSPDEARVIGSVDDQLLLLENPGDLDTTKPPLTLRVGLLAPDATVAGSADGGITDGGHGQGSSFLGRLPAGTYGHRVTSIIDDGDALLLFDVGASPAVLWSVDRGRTGFSVTEGPHRPLVTGNEAIGAQAAPKAGPGGIYWIKRGSSGNALMRMRR